MIEFIFTKERISRLYILIIFLSPSIIQVNRSLSMFDADLKAENFFFFNKTYTYVNYIPDSSLDRQYVFSCCEKGILQNSILISNLSNYLTNKRIRFDQIF